MNPRPPITPSQSRRVIGNSAALMSAQIGTMVIGLVMLPILVHMMGSVAYGVWVVISGLLGYFGVFDFGLGGAFVAQLARQLSDRQALRQIITLGVLAYGFIGIALIPIGFFIASHLNTWFPMPPLLKSQVIPVFWLVYAASFFNLAMNGMGALINALQWMRWQAILRVVTQLLNYSIVMIALVLHQGLYAFSWGLWASSVVVGIAYVLKVWHVLEGRLFYPPWRIPGSLITSLLSYGGWLQINNVANQIIYETDRILTGIYAGLAWVTIYQINYKLGNTVRRIPLSLMGALLPAISRVTDDHRVRQAYVDASRYLGLLTFLMGSALMAALPLLIKGWMGRNYPHESLVFLLLIIAYVSSNLTGIGTTVLRGQLRPQLTSYYTAVTAVVKLSMSLMLAPHFGLLGILVGSLIGSIVGSLYFLSRLFRVLQLTWWSGLGHWLTRLAVATIPIVWIGHQWATAQARTAGRIESGFLGVGVAAFAVASSLLILRLAHFFEIRDWDRIAPLLPAKWRSRLAVMMGTPHPDPR